MGGTTSNEPLRVLHLTDTHIVADTGGGICGVDTFAALDSLLTASVRGSWRPDVVMLTGDLSDDGSAASYHRLRGLLAPLGLPVHCVPGNHDDRASMEAHLAADFIQLARVADYGAWQWVLLDSQVSGAAYGCLSDEELRSLECALEAAGGRHTLVAVHHGPYPVCPLTGCRLQNADRLLALLARFPAARVVIAGHTHCEIDRHVDGVRLLVTPSTCVNATHPNDPEVPRDRPFWDTHGMQRERRGFRRLELHADGSIVTSVVWSGDDSRNESPA